MECSLPAPFADVETTRYLQQKGVDITYLPVKQDGLLDLEVLEKAIRPDTALVSVMTVNNEIGGFKVQDWVELWHLVGRSRTFLCVHHTTHQASSYHWADVPQQRLVTC